MADRRSTKQLKTEDILEIVRCEENMSDASDSEITSNEECSFDSGDIASDSEEELSDQPSDVSLSHVPLSHDEGDDLMDTDLLPSASAEYSSSWCKNLEDFPQELNFMASPGLQGPLQLPPYESCTPLDFYQLFINKEVMKSFKAETNRYARQCIDTKFTCEDEVPRNSRLKGWQPVTLKDVSKFLAILMHMSIVKKPRIVDYWSTQPVLQAPFPQKLMSRNRFQQILWAFHINDNTTCIPCGQPGHDPLHKVRPLIDHLNHTFQSVYMPYQHISIHEALCPWRGRTAFRVYMRDKPTKWGIKIYTLCDSRNGYVCHFEVMCHMPNLSNKPYEVVHRLLDRLKSLGYCLYVGNYYCCPALALSLASANTGLVGTVRPNRKGLPKDLFTQKLQKGDADFRRFKNTLVIRWKDKKDVSVITTVHKLDMITVRTQTEEKRKPTAIVDYNQHISGVDRSDQMATYVPYHRKTIRWWKKLAFHLLSLTLVQAQCLYNQVRKKLGKPTISLEDFVISVATHLAQMPPDELLQTPAAGGGSEITRLTGRHFPIKSPQRQCHVCYMKLRDAGTDVKVAKSKCKRTTCMCKECKKPLCMDPCFEIFHTQKDYTSSAPSASM